MDTRNLRFQLLWLSGSGVLGSNPPGMSSPVAPEILLLHSGLQEKLVCKPLVKSNLLAVEEEKLGARVHQCSSLVGHHGIQRKGKRPGKMTSVLWGVTAPVCPTAASTLTRWVDPEAPDSGRGLAIALVSWTH
jgi:hypothetical protein